jgi:hypothetical protein
MSSIVCFLSSRSFSTAGLALTPQLRDRLFTNLSFWFQRFSSYASRLSAFNFSTLQQKGRRNKSCQVVGFFLVR